MNNLANTTDRTPARFDSQILRAGLPTLRAAHRLSAPITAPDVLAYQQFYGLDFSTETTPITWHIGCEHLAGFEVVIQHFMQPEARGTVWLMHGYYDHTGVFKRAIAELLALGLNVLIFDLPGHGLSSGERAAIKSFATYQDIVRAVIPLAEALCVRPWCIVGQSMGAAITTDFLLHEAQPSIFQHVVLIAPLIRPTQWRLNRVLYYLLHLFLKRVKRNFRASSHSETFVEFVHHGDPLQPRFVSTQWVGALIRWIKKIEAMPACSIQPLIIQGTADQTVDYARNLKILKRLFHNPHCVMIPDARHHLINESDEYQAPLWQAVTDCLKNTVKTH